ncbi:MAG: transaldolase family protein, partial [Paraclostridium sp.]
SLECDKMVEEALELVKLHKNIVIKIPMCIEGVKAVNILNKKNIKTNVTLIFSSQQALIAAKSGATYVSPFVGRLDDIGVTGTNLIEEVSAIFKMHNIKTEIIAASIRNPIHASECALAGADISTIPFNVLKQMTKHPLTDIGIEKFLSDYNK